MRDTETDFSVRLPLEGAGFYSGSLADGTEVQLCSAWLGIAVRALGYPYKEGGDTTAPQKTFGSSSVRCLPATEENESKRGSK